MSKKIALIQGVDAKVDANNLHIFAGRIILSVMKVNAAEGEPNQGEHHMTKKLLWPHEIGRELGVSTAMVRRMADAGAVEAIRDAKGRRRFRVEAIEILRRNMGLEEVSESARANRPDKEPAA